MEKQLSFVKDSAQFGDSKYPEIYSVHKQRKAKCFFCSNFKNCSQISIKYGTAGMVY